jgi:hypothetical protein
MSTLISLNMNLPVPAVGSENGPTYAFDINSCMTLIDQHDHSFGKGIQIQPNGLNISANLDFKGNNAINLNNVVFEAQTAPPAPPPSYTPTQSVFVATTLGVGDLWYANSSGFPIQITSGNGLAPVFGSVQGITYAAGTFVFTQTQSSLTNPAFLDAGSITIRPNVPVATGLGVTLSTQNVSQYSIVFPTLPPSPSTDFVTLDYLGNMAATIPISGGITRSMLAPGALGSSNVQNVAANYTVLNTDDAIFVNALTSNTTITLYSAATNVGRILNIKKTDASNHVVTIVTTGAQTIDGAASTTLNTLNESIELMSDGSNWQILDRKTTTTPVAFTPTVTGWSGVTASRVYSWREGAYLHVQGSFTVGTPNASTTSMSLAFNGVALPGAAPSYLIDVAQTGGGSPVNTIVGYYANDLSTNGRGVVLATASTTTIAFGDNGQHSTSAVLAEAGNVITVTGNTMTFFFKVPIVGWNG